MPPSAPPPPPPHAPTGELLAGRYQLDRRIGQGGMAEVWVATDIDLDRKVAVKWLRSTLATDPVVTERFRREAIAVARLSHDNIVGVHDVFVHDTVVHRFGADRSDEHEGKIARVLLALAKSHRAV